MNETWVSFKLNFTNTLIILTSNVGAKKVSEFGAGVGFSTNGSDEQQFEVKKSMIQKSLKQQFNPEFLNRIDDVFLFYSYVDTWYKPTHYDCRTHISANIHLNIH